MSTKKYNPPKVTFFEFWEIHHIGLAITNPENDEVLFNADIPFEQAKQIHKELGEAIKQFEELEKNCIEKYFEKQK